MTTRQQSIFRHYHEPWLGGPGTLLPFHVEAGLAWILAFGLLSVSGYHYVVETLVKPYWARIIIQTKTPRWFWLQLWQQALSYFFSCPTTQSTTTILSHSKTAVPSKFSSSSSSSTLPFWLPLTTYSRSEVDRATPQERLQQLAILLQKEIATIQAHDELKKQTRVVDATPQQQQDETIPSSSSSSFLTWNNDQQLITIMRSNATLRRLASLAMRPLTVRDGGNNNASSPQIIEASSSSAAAAALLSLRQQLVRIWPALLRLPTVADDDVDDCCLHSSSAISSSASATCHDYSFGISLIIACFRERPSDVRLKLQHALNMARCPQNIQVVLVDAGGNNDTSTTSSDECGLQQVANVVETMICNASPSSQHGNGNDSDFSNTTTTTSAKKEQQQRQRRQQQHCWGSIKIVDFCERQQGRGPALNAGASHSVGRILAFLHSDTKLPVDWDVKLQDTFRYDDKADHVCSNNSDSSSTSPRHDGVVVRANAVAFGFGIDMNGLNSNSRCKSSTLASFARVNDPPHDSSYYPPGLRAVQMTANLRCQLWSLPYGDQCLCLPRSIFEHVGGYPHQCFMEDYELIALLRRRKALVHKFFCKKSEIIKSTIESSSSSTTTTTTAPLEQEALKIIPGPCALCSPRRWQRLGVLYVTYMNSRLVNLYHAHDLTPQDLYERYYGHALRDWKDLAPWELQLLRDLRQSDDKQQRQHQ